MTDWCPNTPILQTCMLIQYLTHFNIFVLAYYWFFSTSSSSACALGAWWAGNHQCQMGTSGPGVSRLWNRCWHATWFFLSCLASEFLCVLTFFSVLSCCFPAPCSTFTLFPLPCTSCFTDAYFYTWFDQIILIKSHIKCFLSQPSEVARLWLFFLPKHHVDTVYYLLQQNWLQIIPVLSSFSG